jgi:hypothetical protein
MKPNDENGDLSPSESSFRALIISGAFSVFSVKQTANFLFSWRDFCGPKWRLFWNKVGSSLRSRRQRKAWGVSPRLVRVENVSPRLRAAAITI